MNTDTRTDAEVIAASLDDLEEFGIIFERHYDAVFAFVARRFYRREAADLASVVFVKAIDLRRRYNPDNPDALPWLYGIAKNVIGDRMRRVRLSEREYLVVSPEYSGTNPYDSADERLDAERIGKTIPVLLRQLTSGQREALLMSALEDLTYAEIADIQGVSALTVGSRLTRAKRRLREAIPAFGQKTGREGDPSQENDGD